MSGCLIRSTLVFFLLSIVALIYTLVAYGLGPFFQLLGILVTIFVGGLVIGLVVLRLVLKKFASGLLKVLGNGSSNPRRVTLKQEERVEWTDAAAVEKSVTALQQLGFTDACTFSIPELPSVKLRAFCNTQEAIYAVVYEAEQLGVWSDLVCRVRDHNGWLRLTYTNSASPHAGLLDTPPDRKLVKAPGADIPSLYHRLLNERPAGERWTISAAEFAQIFMQAWAEEVDWRNARGGPSEDEVRRVAAISGQEVTAEVIDGTRQQLIQQALQQLDETLREVYAAESHVAADQAEELVIVHDKLRNNDIIDEFSQADEDDEQAQAVQLPNLPARQSFAAINQQRPSHKRFKFVGTVNHPLQADVYRPPKASASDADNA